MTEAKPPATKSEHKSSLATYVDRLRGYSELPALSAKELAHGWLPRYFRGLLIQWDSLGFLLAGLAVGLVADYYRTVEVDGETILLGLTAVGFAALAVVLTALTIFVTFVNETYLRVLTISKKGGLSGYIVPYLAAALISTSTTTVGVVCTLIYGAVVSPGWRAAMLGVEVGLVVWTAWGVFQLVVEIAIHGLNRYELTRAVEEAKGPDLSEVLTREAERSTARTKEMPKGEPGTSL